MTKFLAVFRFSDGLLVFGDFLPSFAVSNRALRPPHLCTVLSVYHVLIMCDYTVLGISAMSSLYGTVRLSCVDDV